MDSVWIAIGGFIFLAYTLEAITGFGSIVIALSLSAQLVPIDVVLPVLVPLSVCMSSYLVWQHRHNIDRELLLRTILPGMVLGTLAGYGIKPYLDEALLKQLFGLLILWFASRELWKLHHADVQRIRTRWLTNLLTGAAGLSHGLFASGGPLLVYSLAGVALNKARFRATLVTVWLTLNGLLSVVFLLDGRLLPALPKVAAYLPLLAVGVWLGEHLHRKVSERHFRIAIYCLLIVTGALLAWRR
jgi:uncharacterized membrane protein YfcA